MKLRIRKSLTALLAVAFASLLLVTDDSFARGGSIGGGRSFSAPSRPSAPSGGFFKSSPAPAPAPVYRAPPPAAQPAPAPTVAPGFKTGTPKAAEQPKTFDQRGTTALQKEESRRAYEKAHPPTPAPATANAPSHNRDQRIADLRKDLSREKWENRQLRRDQQYGRYYNQPPVFTQTYRDPFGNMFFWMWLMEQNNHSRDQMIYNHQNDIDPERLAALKAKDTDLEQRLKALEQSGVKRDPSYVPAEFAGNKDLMYGDDVVTQAAKEEHSKPSILLWIGIWAGLSALGYLIYLGVFVKRFK